MISQCDMGFKGETGDSGAIYIYEVPLLSEGTLESASSVSEWNPNPRKTASHHARGLAYADGYLLFGGEKKSSPHPFFTPFVLVWGFAAIFGNEFMYGIGGIHSLNPY